MEEGFVRFFSSYICFSSGQGDRINLKILLSVFRLPL